MYHVHVLGFDDKTTQRPQHTPSRLYDIMPITPVWDVYGYTEAPTTYHLPPLGWGVNGTVSILYKYIGEAFHAPQRQTKSLKETSMSMILRSLRCWWWFTRKPVMVLCLYNSFQHSHSNRVPNYVSTTNNRQIWTIFECGPFHGH